jgi:hypothetical protein
MTATGGSAGVPGPEKVIWPQIPAIKSPANNNIRIAIFMINFLQYSYSSEFLPRKLRIDYMKNRNALQQLRIDAVFANSPMLNIGQCNEFHTH